MTLTGDKRPAVSPWSRLLSASPDALTACGCLLVWISPRALGPDSVTSVLLMMMMEFILVHATGFFTVIAAPDGSRPLRRIAMLAGMSLVYMLFVGVWAWAFHSWWPVFVFGWLVVGKVAWIFANPRSTPDETGRQMVTWAYSVVAYLGGVFGGLFLPLPRLGLDDATVASLHITMKGEWMEHPHTAIAGAVIYYAALALYKAWGGPRLPQQKDAFA